MYTDKTIKILGVLKVEKKKVAFFFGAGAEGKGNFDIVSGYEYLKQSLFPQKDTYQSSLSNFFNNKNCYFSSGYDYTEHTFNGRDFILRNIIRAKCENDINFLNKNIDYIREILTDTEKSSIKECYKKRGEYHKWLELNLKKINKEKDKQKINAEFEDILTEKIKYYIELKTDFLKNLFKNCDGGRIEYDLNVGVGGILDSYFHTIINPQKYGKVKFSKIFNYYWACYFAILTPVISLLKKKTNNIPEEWMITDSALNYNHILNNIHEVTKRLYSQDMTALDIEGTYYCLIKNELDPYKKDIECIGVITTNYYKFCERICNKAVYLNGQLKYFEFPEILEVKDISEEDILKDKIFFPFIFGQSLVKPIINKYQVDVFKQFEDILNNTDILVILGYNINDDDNHINAMLHSYAKSDKRLIVVGEYNNDDEKKAVSQKLKCKEKDIEYCTVKYGNNAEVIDKMFNKILEGIK